MNYKDKTKDQLISELERTHQRINHLETAESECQQAIEEINRSYQVQAVLNKLLRISLKNLELEAMLEQFIDEITSISWLALKSKGAIFLVGKERDVLEMKAHRSLNTHSLKMCARVPFGTCLCGRAAMSGENQFADRIDERHDLEYHGISPHGHYCVPIISGSAEVLGVIALYVTEGHQRNRREEDFLSATADTLAGIIELRKTQQKLRERGAELENKSQDLEELNIALRVLLKKREEDKTALENDFLSNIKHLVQPYLKMVKSSGLDEKQRSYINILESNIIDIISPLAHKLNSRHLNLSALEIQVANLIIDGRRTKEIASLLTLSAKTIEVHRKNIRKKLGLTNSKTNLRTHLLSLQE
jgi:DNA-binding CsgD family transcriptional regulator/putative methionine-R-sulfoxide reductase with GAF domain